jgi:hypothetical protein
LLSLLVMLVLLQVTKVDTSGTAKAVVQSFKEMGTSSSKPVSVSGALHLRCPFVHRRGMQNV